jgi:hypothetical protein
MKPYALLVFDADYQVWQKLRESDSLTQSHEAYDQVRQARLYQIVALVRVHDTHVILSTVTTDLTSLPEFCAATAK